MYNYETTPITDKYKILAAQLATQLVVAEIEVKFVGNSQAGENFTAHADVIYQWLTKNQE